MEKRMVNQCWFSTSSNNILRALYLLFFQRGFSLIPSFFERGVFDESRNHTQRFSTSQSLRSNNIFLLVFFVSLLFLPVPVVAARQMSISSPTLSLAGDSEMTITATYSGFTDGEIIYLKGLFFKDNDNNYFGYTKKNDTWVKSSTTNPEQKSITIGDWDGTLVVKSDWVDGDFVGDGQYNAQVRFYYLTGSNNENFNMVKSSNDLITSITAPTPTLTPTRAPTFTPAPTNVPATSVPQADLTNTLAPTSVAISTPVPTASISPTVKKSPTRTPTLSPRLTGVSASTSSGLQVLGETSNNQPIGEEPLVNPPENVSSGRVSYKPIIITMLLVSTGLAMIAGVLVWQKRNAGRVEGLGDTP